MFNFGYLSSGHSIYVSKDVRIRGYFSEQKRGQREKKVWEALLGAAVTIQSLNVAIEWIAVIPRTMEVQGCNFMPKIDCTRQDFSGFSQSLRVNDCMLPQLKP
jgi:hypothetical protein